MTNKNNVIQLPGCATYGELLEKHLSDLTDEQKNARIDEMILIRSAEDGLAFYILEGEDIVHMVGLVELVKTYLLTSQIDVE